MIPHLRVASIPAHLSDGGGGKLARMVYWADVASNGDCRVQDGRAVGIEVVHDAKQP